MVTSATAARKYPRTRRECDGHSGGDAVANDDAVIVASEHGQVLHVNETLQRWLNVDNPDLEMIARGAQPVDTFLELFTREAQASLQMNQRWVEATSHRVPADGGQRMVVVLRELTANTTNPEALDLNRAINVVNEIGETVNASQGLEPVLQGAADHHPQATARRRGRNLPVG